MRIRIPNCTTWSDTLPLEHIEGNDKGQHLIVEVIKWLCTCLIMVTGWSKRILSCNRLFCPKGAQRRLSVRFLRFAVIDSLRTFTPKALLLVVFCGFSF